MKNIIFLSMSTLPWSKIHESDYTAPDGTVIRNCQSQLEPVVRYIMTKCKGEEVYILNIATKETKKQRIVGNMKQEDNGRFVTRYRPVRDIKENESIPESLESGEEVTTALSFFEARIRSSDEYQGLASCRFENDGIDLKKPEAAIRASVEKIESIRKDTSADQLRLWIDTHGGLRDVALLINAVGYLLDSFKVIPIKGIFGIETDNHLIIDQSNAFYSLSFVSGMSDFMNFGNVDVLKKYYETEISGGDNEIKALIDAMQLVSDGTQFCDPYLYKKGLDALSKAIPKNSGDASESPKALLPIFYNRIKNDYGNLLHREESTDLDIIERCMKKKQYQQALTFVEALMPQYFFDKQILYFSDKDLERAKIAAEKSYKSAVNTAFDSFMEKVKNVFSENDVRNALIIKTGIFAGITSAEGFNETIRVALESAPADITLGIRKDLPISKLCSVGKDEKNGEKIKIKYKTKLRNNMPSVARVMQMHNILKNSRNKFNHAVESNETLPISEQRPELDHVVKVLENYISEIRKLEKL